MIRPTSALAEMVLMNEILNTLSMVDPLHAKITNLFADDSENTAIDIWNRQYDEVLLEARQRIN